MNALQGENMPMPELYMAGFRGDQSYIFLASDYGISRSAGYYRSSSVLCWGRVKGQGLL